MKLLISTNLWINMGGSTEFRDKSPVFSLSCNIILLNQPLEAQRQDFIETFHLGREVGVMPKTKIFGDFVQIPPIAIDDLISLPVKESIGLCACKHNQGQQLVANFLRLRRYSAIFEF